GAAVTDRGREAGGALEARIEQRARGRHIERQVRRVGDRRDVDRHRVGRGVEIGAAVGRTAVVLHLEGEARIAGAGGRAGRRVASREEGQLAGRDGGRRHELAGGHGRAVQQELTGTRQRGDLDGLQAVGRAVIRIGEAEVRGREGDGRVFVGRDGAVGSCRSVVDRRDGDGDGVDV